MSGKAETTKSYHGTGREYWRRLGADLVRDRWLYLLLLPGLVYFVIFKYLPMWGIVISFENYVPYSGIMGSEWVGLKWFEYFFKFPSWTRYLVNTLLLSFMNLIFYFPAPIILALLLNEMRSLRYKKILQTFLYVPHFISIVIVVSITYVIFGSDGIIYKLTEQLTGAPIKYKTRFMKDKSSVLVRYLVHILLEKKYSNHLKPTHLLPKMPAKGE